MSLTNLTDTEIEAHADHPDVSEADVREALSTVNSDILDYWSAHEDAVDDGAMEIVHEDRDSIVLADHSGHFWREQFDAVGLDDGIRNAILSLQHELARDRCDYSWSAVYPVVVFKTDEWQAGEEHALREIARRTQETGSVARAVDQFATEVHGWSKSAWARQTDRNVSTVSRMTSEK